MGTMTKRHKANQLNFGISAVLRLSIYANARGTMKEVDVCGLMGFDHFGKHI